MTLFDHIYQQVAVFLPELLPELSTSIVIILALLLDKYLGEARRFHYLVGFGWLATQLERYLNAANPHNKVNSSKTQSTETLNTKLAGLFSWCLLVLPLPIIYVLYLDAFIWYWQIILDAFVLYFALGLNSLYCHAMQVYRPLKSNNLEQARHFTGYLVSRETQTLSAEEMSRATVESMLENGHDSVIASLFYYVIGGAPLVILHRFANTLDAMWGYKNERYIHFGYASAKLDDLLGFFSGKVCTLLYAIQGNFIKSLVNAYQQGNQYKSHNGGWVMAAGATMMKCTLGGTAIYHGKALSSVGLGCGNLVTIEDIPRSVTLVSRAAIIFCMLVFTIHTFQLTIL